MNKLKIATYSVTHSYTQLHTPGQIITRLAIYSDPGKQPLEVWRNLPWYLRFAIFNLIFVEIKINNQDSYLTAIKVSMVFYTRYIDCGWVLEIFIDILHGEMTPKALVAGSHNVQKSAATGRHITIFMLECLPFSQKCLFQCFWKGRHPSSHGHKRHSFLPPLSSSLLLDYQLSGHWLKDSGII